MQTNVVNGFLRSALRAIMVAAALESGPARERFQGIVLVLASAPWMRLVEVPGHSPWMARVGAGLAEVVVPEPDR